MSEAAVQVRTCRSCGCTDERACPGGCTWVEADLCSACAIRAHGFYPGATEDELRAELHRLSQRLLHRERARRIETRSQWEAYLRARTGNYDMRRARYRAVASHLITCGLDNDDIVVDVGAGWTEFDYFLRTEISWRGRYLAVDGAIDGTDLDAWVPTTPASFFVAIEVLEHLREPLRVLAHMRHLAEKAVVITTPNPATVDVLAIDSTHRCALPRELLAEFCAMEVYEHSCFGRPDDTLIAVARA